jgi:hypothetical protein
MENRTLTDYEAKMYYAFTLQDCHIYLYSHLVAINLKIATREQVESFYDRVNHVDKIRKEQRYNRFWQMQQVLYYNPN